jgi:hypothetical protein
MRMKMQKIRVRCVYVNRTWNFVDEAGNKIEFDQAVIQPIYQTPTVVEGYVISVHGIDMEMAQHFDADLRKELGIVYPVKIPPVNCLRLMPGGLIERVDFRKD